MAQFDVYRNPNPATRAQLPLLLDIQTQLLDDLATRVVVPLGLERAETKRVTRLMPVLDIEGKRFVMHTPELASIGKRALGPAVASLVGKRTEIVAALDVLISGV